MSQHCSSSYDLADLNAPHIWVTPVPHAGRRYLVINARLASGKNKEDRVVWEPNFVEGFVKGADIPSACQAVP